MEEHRDKESSEPMIISVFDVVPSENKKTLRDFRFQSGTTGEPKVASGTRRLKVHCIFIEEPKESFKFQNK